jgi:F-type H+-transporting ATPase subunit gamma
LLVIITSKEDFVVFNSNIVKKAIQSINSHYAEAYRAGKLDIIAIGKKGADQLKSKNYPVVATYHQLFDKLNFEETVRLSNTLMENFIKQQYGIIKLVYNQFRNAAVQDVAEEFFLPLFPVRETEDRYESRTDYIYEPSDAEILDEMIPYTLRIQLFRSLLESNASEHGARMTAMHKATDNATELIRELELHYNKARQAAITSEILEIVGGAEALKE